MINMDTPRLIPARAPVAVAAVFMIPLIFFAKSSAIRAFLMTSSAVASAVPAAPNAGMICVMTWN